MKRLIAAFLLMLVSPAAVPSVPEAESPLINVRIYHGGKFFTPSDIPEMKGYLCLAAEDPELGLIVYCAPSPFIV